MALTVAVVALTTLGFATSAAVAQGPPDGVPPQPGVDVPPESPGPFFVPPGLAEDDVDEEEEGAIAGTVTDGSDDAGIEDATVTVVEGPTDAEVTTDADGDYVLDELEVGDYDVEVAAEDYETTDASGIAVDDGVTTTLDFTLDAVEVEGGTYVAVYDLSEGFGSAVELPLGGQFLDDEVDVVIDWGDGTEEAVQERNPSHTYEDDEGTFTVTVTGTFESLSAGFSTDGQDSLISVEEWSDTGTVSAGNAFRDAENLESVATPPHTVTTMNAMFRNAESFDQDLDDWDTSNVEDMNQMFWRARGFNGNIGDWDTSNVERMFMMFQGADAFDQDLNDWDTGNVVTMRDMFLGAESFDGAIGDWDTGNVQHMGSMFQDAESFDQDLNDWDTSNVENMQQMFWEARAFNGAIGDWDTSNVENMRGMFWDARAFNRDIGGWDTGNVEDMTQMFWDAREFDQDLNDWDTSNVDSMEWMFSDAREFDQDISEWDTSNVEDMTRMFRDAETFNQDLSPWCVEDIESQPDGFALGADEWEEPQPDWGAEC